MPKSQLNNPKYLQKTTEKRGKNELKLRKNRFKLFIFYKHDQKKEVKDLFLSCVAFFSTRPDE
jgi:hypothetical protein